jgi:hypothetical protein
MPNAKEIFDNRIPEALKQHPDKAREINAIYTMKVTGDGGGEWTVDLVANPPTIVHGEAGNAQCTITMANEDFEAMMENPQLGMQLYFQGKLTVVGDPMLATRMTKLLKLGDE